MDLENIMLSEISQTETDRHYITYMWKLKYNTVNLYQNRNRLTDIENKFMITKREREEAGGEKN